MTEHTARNRQIKQAKPAHRLGPRTTYSDELALEICRRHADGETLSDICAPVNMPDRVTVWRWQEDHPEFATAFGHARVEFGRYYADKVLTIADGCTSKTALAARVKIAAFQWAASKHAPKQFGEKLDLNLAGQPDGVPIRTVSIVTSDPVEAARAYQELMGGRK